MKKTINILKLTAILLILAGGFSCKETEEREAPLTPCHLQTERREEMDIRNVETVILKEYPENQFGLSSFICEREGIQTFHAIAGAIVSCFEICNFPQYAKEWSIPDDGLSVVITGNTFTASRDHDLSWMYIFFDLELTSLERKEL
jgi:hypothetical protein